MPASLSASISITEARAHALLGDAHETRRTLTAADQAMSRANPDRDPAWLSPWTPAHHAGGTMHALRDLGQPREAAKHAPDALNAPATHSRTRALHTVLHASVLAAAGDLDAAAANARRATDLARPLKSRRLHQRLNELDGWLKPHATVPAIADAREHLHTAHAVTEAGRRDLARRRLRGHRAAPAIVSGILDGGVRRECRGRAGAGIRSGRAGRVRRRCRLQWPRRS